MAVPRKSAGAYGAPSRPSGDPRAALRGNAPYGVKGPPTGVGRPAGAPTRAPAGPDTASPNRSATPSGPPRFVQAGAPGTPSMAGKLTGRANAMTRGKGKKKGLKRVMAGTIGNRRPKPATRPKRKPPRSY